MMNYRFVNMQLSQMLKKKTPNYGGPVIMVVKSNIFFQPIMCWKLNQAVMVAVMIAVVRISGEQVDLSFYKNKANN